ncbi:MAG TPA: tRNA (N(6)-L-threonylcarbamoyladenosine(37)-C(2))-methylthiotransferase MtaB [Clostridiales bacterium]|nr:MAG: tRNA (N(6)-L-threonylcarbamoyladenosine(37)-C(2))-methylthiotransferase MtaB [Clostridiales bacterium GWD2_32_19]HCC08278.1 tRNA (N(6)-L-threonylcarbamoyladenosine(37)-C(2))-methylthiotransferase MtaB [Clostridiales bacterium]
MKVAGYNLGCKVNKYELDSVLEEFKKNDYEIVDFGDIADVYIVNTCAVTQLAERKSRQMINRAKSKNYGAIFVAAGCYTQKEGESITDVDIVIGTNNKDKIYKMVEEYIKNREKILLVESISTEKIYDDMKLSSTQDATRAYVKIQDGCKNYCTYCIIPYLRGAVRSRKLVEVLEEVEMLAKKGYKEIVLAGIEVASFGEDLGDIKLIQVLEETSKVRGVERIRLSSMYPTVVDEEFVSSIKNLNNICNHFHLSLQSGCNATLKRMNRRYTTEQYRQGIKLLKKNILDVAITTDIIVGFPGETEEEFEATYNFVKEMKFSKIHVFKYSKRKGTKAEILENQIDENIKNNRSSKMIKLGESLEQEFLKNYIGRELDVLFEGKIKSKDNRYPGHSMNYLKVVVESAENIKNEIKTVKIEKVEKDYLVGSLYER